jgi:hypothetical protein
MRISKSKAGYIDAGPLASSVPLSTKRGVHERERGIFAARQPSDDQQMAFEM